MKEFNYEAAKNGAPVQTRDGRKVRIIFWDKKGEFPIVAFAEKDGREICYDYDKNGYFTFDHKASDADLVMAPEKHEGWINIYTMGESKKRFTGRAIHESEEAAKKASASCRATAIKIEWTE